MVPPSPPSAAGAAPAGAHQQRAMETTSPHLAAPYFPNALPWSATTAPEPLPAAILGANSDVSPAIAQPQRISQIAYVPSGSTVTAATAALAAGSTLATTDHPPAPGTVPPVGVAAINLAPTKKGRTTQACVTCRRRKIRCSGGFPCAHCHEFGVPCEYGQPAKRGPKAPRSQAGSPLSSGASSPVTAGARPPRRRRSPPPPNGPTSPGSSFNPLSALDTASSPSSRGMQPSTQQDIQDIVSNLTLLVTLDENGRATDGFASFGNSSGYHLLKGLPDDGHDDGVNVFISQLAKQRMLPVELAHHSKWLPPRNLAHLLLDSYFAVTAHWLPMLTRVRTEAYVDQVYAAAGCAARVVEAHLSAGLPSTGLTSPRGTPPSEVFLLVYAVLAVGALTFERRHFAFELNVPISRLLVARARRLLPRLFEAPAGRIEGVQACLLMAVLDNGQAAGSTWLMDGMAARLALALGLHVDPRAVVGNCWGAEAATDAPFPPPAGPGRSASPLSTTSSSTLAAGRSPAARSSPEASSGSRSRAYLIDDAAPAAATRMVTWSIVLTLDRLSAASHGRPVMIHDDDCILDLKSLVETPESRAKSGDTALLLPSSSYWPHYYEWVLIAGRVLRAVNSFRYRRSHLPATLLPELHASLTQFRQSIPPHLEFDPAVFSSLGPTDSPPQVALESAWLAIAYHQTIVYLYRPLVATVVAGVIANMDRQMQDAAAAATTASSSRAADSSAAPPPLRPTMMLARRVLVPLLNNQAPPPDTPEPSSRLPSLYPQYLSTLERAVQAVVHIFVTISPWHYFFWSAMLHQVESVLAAARVVVAGGGSPENMYETLRELPRVLARLVPSSPVAADAYDICIRELAELQQVIRAHAAAASEKASANASDYISGPSPIIILPVHIRSEQLTLAAVAQRHAAQSSQVAEAMEDRGTYAHLMAESARAYMERANRHGCEMEVAMAATLAYSTHQQQQQHIQARPMYLQSSSSTFAPHSMPAAAPEHVGFQPQQRFEYQAPPSSSTALFGSGAAPLASMTSGMAAGGPHGQTAPPPPMLLSRSPLDDGLHHTPPPQPRSHVSAQPDRGGGGGALPHLAWPPSSQFPSFTFAGGAEAAQQHHHATGGGALVYPPPLTGMGTAAADESHQHHHPYQHQQQQYPLASDGGCGHPVPPPVLMENMALPEFPLNFGEWALQVLPEGFDLHF
ncbi:hypothetical protein BC828DRAFT_378807 [Blastocladiella britannica]|nr:hypothetical protein BC828DRAFT_378807 [Blastocladiella britannica]